MAPDYDLGIAIFTAGPPTLLDLVREIVTVPLLQAAELVAQQDLKNRYSGTFVAKAPLNSTLVLKQSASKSLYIESLISNSTVVFHAWEDLLSPLTQGRPFRIQLVPTLLDREDGTGRQGEVWRGTLLLEDKEKGVWDDHCMTDIDPLSYAGKPLLEIVFWEGKGEKVEELEMVGFRVSMTRVGDSEEEAESGSKLTTGGEQQIIG
jgi:hypothetical protein